MSGQRDIDEAGMATKPADNSALSSFVDNTRNSMSPKDYANSLQSPGKDNLASLPSLELMDAKADVPPPPEIKKPSNNISDSDLDHANITRQHDKGDTTTAFPNGVKIHTGGAGTEATMDNGQKAHISGAMHVDKPKGAHESHPGSHVIVDSHNKPLYQENKDGSKTVYTEDGTYDVHKDGSVTAAHGFKGRDGSFTHVDTESVLGGLPPNDLGKITEPVKSSDKTRGH